MTLILVAGCSDDAEGLPVRAAPLPAEVSGLGPAVLAVPVADDRRDDLTGLLAVARFGDDLAGLTPDRRHVEIALGDPRFPTVAQGLAEDRRDALLVGGRLRDITLPSHVNFRKATAIGPTLSITASRCLTVTDADTVTQPARGAVCAAAVHGGVTWQDRPGGRYGGIDLTSGAASPAVELPAPPIAATADGRYLATVTVEKPRRLVIADTSTGRSQVTVTVPDPTEVVGFFTDGGFAVLHRPGNIRTISLVTPDGDVRTLLAPVGEVAFAPDGRHAVVADNRSGTSRLAVLDLTSGTVRPVVDGGGQLGERRPGAAELPPVSGAVTARAFGDTALVVDLPGASAPEWAPRPSRIWSVRLSTATAITHPDPPKASGIRAHKSTATPAEAAAMSALAAGSGLPLAALTLRPGGETVTVTPGGTVTVVPSGATPRGTLGRDAVLCHLTDSEGRERADRLLIVDGTGRRTEVPTGADRDQRVDRVLPTPDGAHLLISLRAFPLRWRPGPLDTVVVARRDGAGEPVVVYQGAVLVSLGSSG
ncbi:hypothetical protein O7606_12390 [Micromonospora sp. WMMD882]|uniref:TolB family protein n=1 Tax=Micromonospora sp. WMMD882 TaxID=3015151 RepID=UPI00248C63A9|nr:hypothetical protein [Micromonospora sp. WMMD882]WBB82088.1 hypothetical protein O7606_12390 [Micromonospora sp. WMMD882]